MQMRKKLGAAGTGAAGGDRAITPMRPVVEAALVAAVAFGCAQVGWAVLTPNAADATAANGANADSRLPRIDAAPVLSPFADAALSGEAGSAAAFAAASNLSLAGVRVAAETDRSSAVIALADGAQRAFRIGDEIADGVRLASVSGDYVIVSYPGGQRQLTIAPPPVSFARALMGQTPAPVAAAATAAAPQSPLLNLTPADITPFSPSDAKEAPVLASFTQAAPLQSQVAVQSPVAAPAPVIAAAVPDPAGERAFIAQLVAHSAQIEAGGWRIATDAAPQTLALGLKPGDLVVAVNGADASHAAAAMAAVAQGDPISLTVERDGARLTLSPTPTDAPAAVPAQPVLAQPTLAQPTLAQPVLAP